MAGTMDEFDDAVPLKKTFCGRPMTEEEYEDQAAKTTDRAISDLLKHLEENPQVYKKIESRKRREEAEEAGIMSLIKVRLLSYWNGEESGFQTPTKQECDEGIEKLKNSIRKAHNYSQECRGRDRRSSRLAKKRLQVNVAPPPPPPPPLPPPRLQSLTADPHPLLRRSHRIRQKKGQTSSERNARKYCDVLSEIASAAPRKNLRKTVDVRSPGGTPMGGWKSTRQIQPDALPYFNTRLLEKFRHVTSPASSSPNTSFN